MPISFWDFSIKKSGLGGSKYISSGSSAPKSDRSSPLDRSTAHSQPGREPKDSWLAPAENVHLYLTWKTEITWAPKTFIDPIDSQAYIT